MRRAVLLVGAVALVAGVAFLGGASGAARLASASTVKFVGPIVEMRADAGRAIVLVEPTGLDPSLGSHCADVLVWDRAASKVVTVFDHRKCEGTVRQSFFGVALAGNDAAWVEGQGGNESESMLHVTSLASGRDVLIGHVAAGVDREEYTDNPQGDGPLLVFNHYLICEKATADWKPGNPCPPGYASGAIISDRITRVLPKPDNRLDECPDKYALEGGVNRCHAIARANSDLTVLAVGGGRVVARLRAGGLIVLAPRAVSTRLVSHKGYEAERLIATYPYKPGEVFAAATDGRTLAVLRGGALDVIPLPGSPGTRTTRKLPPAISYGSDRPVAQAELRLSDVDGQIAVYIRHNAVYLLNLATGRSIVFARPTARPVNAQLEPDGLYVAAGRTLTFTPRDQIEQRLRR
jgi:hypothetical protein